MALPPLRCKASVARKKTTAISRRTPNCRGFLFARRVLFVSLVPAPGIVECLFVLMSNRR